MLIGEHRIRQFPESTIGLVDGDGRSVGPKRANGVEVVLHRTLSGYCAEVMDIKTGGDAHYAEVGIWVEGNVLMDYDGVFDLPSEVREMLKEEGVVCDTD